MLIVHVTERCKNDALRHSMTQQLERFVEDVEKRQTTSAFDQFPRPFFVKKKFAGRQGRLIAAEKTVEYKGEKHNVLVFLAILIRGNDDYDSPTGFGHDPEGYGRRYLLPVFDVIDLNAIVASRLDDGDSPQPKQTLTGQEWAFLAKEQSTGLASDDKMLCESKKWVDEVVKCEDLLPRLKDQIYEIADLGSDETTDGVPQKIKVKEREDYSIAYQWLEAGKRLFLYDLVKGDAEPDGAIPLEKLNDVQKFLYREYPDWMLLTSSLAVRINSRLQAKYAGGLPASAPTFAYRAM